MTGPAYLFCPADRPDRVLKAAAAADVVIIDLEDAVAPRDRELARAGLATIAPELDPDRTIVRVNAIGTADLERDLVTVRGLGLTRCMVPKAESGEALESFRGLRVFALCETPLGVLRAGELAAAGSCEGLMWGSEDLAASLGAWGSRDDTGLRSALSAARDAVLLAARAYGVLALDTVFPDVADEDGLRRESVGAATAGWDAKACIHPRQLGVVREAFRPPEDRRAWADEVLASAAAAGGVAMVGGAMVDEPVLRVARRISERADRS